MNIGLVVAGGIICVVSMCIGTKTEDYKSWQIPVWAGGILLIIGLNVG